MRYFNFLAFLCCFLCVSSQNQLNNALKSKIYNNELNTQNFDVLINGDINRLLGQQKSLGIIIKYHVGDIACVSLNVNAIQKLIENKLVKYIEYIEPRKKTMNDTMIVRNRIKHVKLGTTPLPQAYDGTGIIMGIIDSGIDFSNPDFKDAFGNTRIQYLWDQTVVSGTNVPSPFNYGNEWTAAQINANQCSHTDLAYWGHGTHVSGIAAGNGLANGTHEGCAPKTDIVFVALDFQKAGPTIADAVQYIVNKATSLNKPFVINASVGDYYGSHDATDAEAKLIENLIKNIPGRAMVAAAGNAGSIKYHTCNMVTPADTNFTWFTDNASTLNYWLYADTNDIKNVKYSIGVNRPNFFDLGNIGFKGYNYGSTLKSDTIKHNGNRIGIVQSLSSVNPYGVYELYVKVLADSLSYLWRIESNGTGKFDAWNFDFVSTALPTATVYPKIVKYIMPDTISTIVSGFQCSDEIITVANYVNLNSYYDVTNTLQTTTEITGALASSSSSGPTRKNNIKPDIAASGASIFSSMVLSMQTNLINNAPTAVAQGSFHVIGGGTSASSPVVAGLAALYMQAYPLSNNKKIKQAITNCAYSDSFTGFSLPNNKWGYGKLDGFNTFICSTAFVNQLNTTSDKVAVQPNPFSESTSLKFEEVLNGEIQVYNAIGELVLSDKVNAKEYQLQKSKLQSSGIYFIHVKTLNLNYTVKVILAD